VEFTRRRLLRNGLIGGALGSGFESQDAVRRVAFGVRERHRREEADAEPG